MIRITLQNLLCIILFCTLFISHISAQEVDNEIDDELGDIEIDKSIVNNEVVDEYEYDEDEERIRNIKMPHVDGIKEKVIKKIDIPRIIHQYGKYLLFIFKF